MMSRLQQQHFSRNHREAKRNLSSGSSRRSRPVIAMAPVVQPPSRSSSPSYNSAKLSAPDEVVSASVSAATSAAAMMARSSRRPGARAWYCDTSFDDVVTRKRREYTPGGIRGSACSTSLSSTYGESELNSSKGGDNGGECSYKERRSGPGSSSSSSSDSSNLNSCLSSPRGRRQKEVLSPTAVSSAQFGYRNKTASVSSPPDCQNLSGKSDSRNSDEVGHWSAQNVSATPAGSFKPRPLGGALSDPETVVELCPGVYARLRGANETWSAIENDFYVPVGCLACSTEVLCIQDASFMLCPLCQIVSPLGQSSAAGAEGSTMMLSPVVDGGVGLGFTYEDLFKWQTQIVQQRQQRQADAASRATAN